MFVVSMIAPDGFPVAMGIYGSMEQAICSVHESDTTGQAQITWKSDVYTCGTLMVFPTESTIGYCAKFSIVGVELSLRTNSVFHPHV